MFQTTNQKVMKGVEVSKGVPSGNDEHSYEKIHHLYWENQLSLWSFSIATLNYQKLKYGNTYNIGLADFLRRYSILSIMP